METLLFTVIVLVVCVAGLGIGVIIKNKSLKGSCGATEAAKQANVDLDCGVCPTQEKDLCPSEDEEGYVTLAQVGNPSREKDFSRSKHLK